MKLELAPREVVARRNSPVHGCSSKCPGSGSSPQGVPEGAPHPNRDKWSPLFCEELEPDHEGDHRAGLLHWPKVR